MRLVTKNTFLGEEGKERPKDNGISLTRPSGPGQSQSRYVYVFMYEFISPPHVIYFKASLLPSDHMISSRPLIGWVGPGQQQGWGSKRAGEVACWGSSRAGEVAGLGQQQGWNSSRAGALTGWGSSLHFLNSFSPLKKTFSSISQNNRKKIENTKKKWIDDFTILAAMDLKNVLVIDPDPKRPVSFQIRTRHILPVDNFLRKKWIQ